MTEHVNGHPMNDCTHCFPEVGVSDLDKALEHYTARMGFVMHWRAGDEIAVVGDGTVSIFLRSSESGGIGPSRTILNVKDADSVYAAWKSAGVRIVEPIETQPWGMREFVAVDLDGNEFRVGHVDETEADYSEHTTE